MAQVIVAKHDDHLPAYRQELNSNFAKHAQ